MTYWRNASVFALVVSAVALIAALLGYGDSVAWYFLGIGGLSWTIGIAFLLMEPEQVRVGNLSFPVETSPEQVHSILDSNKLGAERFLEEHGAELFIKSLLKSSNGILFKTIKDEKKSSKQWLATVMVKSDWGTPESSIAVTHLIYEIGAPNLKEELLADLIPKYQLPEELLKQIYNAYPKLKHVRPFGVTSVSSPPGGEGTPTSRGPRTH